ERLYAVRLDRLRALEDCRALLLPLDHQGLLADAVTAAGPAPEELEQFPRSPIQKRIPFCGGM
ncbi:MAG: hypothetical protein DI613_21870, partial [Kocuria rhizophila]